MTPTLNLEPLLWAICSPRVRSNRVLRVLWPLRLPDGSSADAAIGQAKSAVLFSASRETTLIGTLFWRSRQGLSLFQTLKRDTWQMTSKDPVGGCAVRVCGLGEVRGPGTYAVGAGQGPSEFHRCMHP